MREIQLTNGRVAYIDDEDYDLVMKHKWFAVKCTNTYYAYTHIKKNGKDTTLKMHRLIMGFTNPKILVDHRDRNGLNNQKHNMRESNSTQNNANRVSRGTSKYLGVCWKKQDSMWQVRVTYNKVIHYVGIFKDEIEAAKAYDKKALEIHGEFANLNFPILPPIPECL